MLIVLASAGTAGALDLDDPCRGVQVGGLRGLSCPQVGRITRTVNDILAQSVGRSLPVLAAAPGFVYRYDPETDAFERETSVPGQLYIETPTPVGRDRWNVSISYQHVAFDSLNGAPLDALSDTQPPIRLRVNSTFGSFVVPLTIPALEVDVETQQVTASATYGITSDFDVNLTVPVVYATSALRFRFTLPLGGARACQVIQCTGTEHHSELGLGDVFLRGRYRLLHRPWGEVASGLVVRLPTGDADALHGSGAGQVAPMAYAAGAPVRLGAAAFLRPYLNAGINLDAGDVDQSEGRWGVGLDLGVADRATLGVGFLGRHLFGRSGPPGVFDVPRCRGLTAVACAPGPSAPLLGLSNQRPDFFDASVGLRVDLWRDVLIGFANALVPLNDDGLRANVIPLVGIEGAF